MTTVASAKKYEELLSAPAAASPYEYETLFKGDGFYGRQRAKSRFKLLKGIDVKLRAMLEPGEKVYFVTPGTTVTLGERFFVGWLAHYLNLRALVFTSRRILLIQISAWNRPLELVSQLPYASIASVKSTWNGMCAVRLLSRETLNFQSVPKADRKFLVEFLADIVQLTNAPFEHKRGIEHLCPHCYAYVPMHPLACPACTGEFKSARKAGLLSLALPGVGGWYLGHRWSALLEMVGTGALWYFLVVVPVVARLTDESYVDGGREYWLTVAVALAIAHLVDAVTTYHFGLKGHYPKGAAPLPSSLPHVVHRPKPDQNAANKLKISRTAPPT